jgi:hypothetical protein
MHADPSEKVQHIDTLVPLKIAYDNWVTKHILILDYPSIGINGSPFEETSDASRETGYIILYLHDVRVFAFYSTA